jgi:hypothetical protein
VGARCNIYFDRHLAWFKYFTYQLVLVLSPNYKQNILRPPKVRKVCYSLAELHVKSLNFNLFRWRSVKFITKFKEGASYKSLETSALYSLFWEQNIYV